MSFHSRQFANSSLLGSRAQNVYEWFLASLHLAGDVAECGVFKGETSRELVRYLEDNQIPKRVHMFDTFEGFPEIITAEEKARAEGDELGTGRYLAPLETVIERMARFSQYKIHKGLFAFTFADFSESLCFIHADADLYQSTVEVIHLADKCLVPGGRIVFDDYDNAFFPGIKMAIEKYLSPEKYIITPSASSIQCFAIKR